MHRLLPESFPRMWDQPAIPERGIHAARIIPTYVGSTNLNDYIFLVKANHSHVCGINVEFEVSERYPDESFPRMWDQRYSD